ncbi:glycosyltransferase family 4 protein [Terriglobus albidus]|uniref:glycosyltransferase family 4 protein n=1 Tax=Terriglobus albidus TaxID=1592106 RepID=UPI0021E0E6D1|nr:glycosyltransferase family 4 protein [Terriglobus albidus]
MSVVPIAISHKAMEGTQPDGSSLRVWLSDPLCFTPWYTAALARALASANVSLRLLSASVSREPEYFAQVSLSPDPGPFHFDDLANGWPSSLRRVLRCAAAISNSIALARTLESTPSKRPDILHLQQLPLLNHNIGSDFELLAAARRCGIPVVHTVHNLLPHDTGNRRENIFGRLYRSVDHLICHSRDIADTLEARFDIPSNFISVIPHGPLFESREHINPSDARAALKLPQDRPIVLWQGVMATYKGLDLLLQAWRLTAPRWRNRSAAMPLLVIAGTGSSEVEAAVQAAATALPDSVRADIHYIPTNRLPSYYHAADLLVYPYRSITTSGALLTGLCYRKPIIASDLPPFREYLEPGENALLVPPGNVAALSSALEEAIGGIAKLHQQPRSESSKNIYLGLLLGAANNHRRYVGWDQIARQTIGVYRATIATKAAQPKVCKTLHTFPKASFRKA